MKELEIITDKAFINANYTENPWSKDAIQDKYIFVKTKTKSVKQNVLLQRTFEKLPGIRRETIEMAIKVFQQTAAEALLNGENISTLLFHASTTLKGSSGSMSWDAERNSVNVSIRPTQALRNLIKATQVNVSGKRQSAHYIETVIDNETLVNDNTVSAGYCMTILGKRIKVAGNEDLVGVWLINQETQETIKMKPSALLINTSSRLMIQLPSRLTEGDYTLKIASQASTGKQNFDTKAPYEMTTDIYVSEYKEE